MTLDNNTIAQQLIINFCEGYKKRDLPFLLSLFTKNVNLWGTGIDEYRRGLQEMELQLKRDWSQSEKGSLEILSFVPTPEDANWAAAICNTTITVDGKDHFLENLRGTVIIEQEAGAWKIAHFHCSFPDQRNPEGSSFPIESSLA